MGEKDVIGTGPQDSEVQEFAAAEVASQNTEEINKIIDGMTLFDDDLMSKVFDKNIEATELLLHIVLQRNDIHILEVIGQYDMKSPYVGGREIRLDIKASDSEGNDFDVEVQRDIKGSSNRRVRFHSAMVDARMLREKQKFNELRDSYVIFICQHDKFHQGKPIYHIDKVVREIDEEYADGSNVIFVNGTYKGDDEIGKLVHDFSSKDSSDMYYQPLADGAKHVKGTKKGRESMCEAVESYAEKYGNKVAEQTKVNLVKSLMDSMKLSMEQAMTALKIEGDERTIIAKQINQ